MVLTVTASDIVSLYRPSKCDLRIYLKEKGFPKDEESPFEAVLRKLGQRHEERHLGTIGPHDNLGVGNPDDRVARTVEHVRRGVPAIYHGLFRANMLIGDEEVLVIGEPDFMVRSGDGYIIRDAKISRRITQADHPEIFFQLQLYSWLYRQIFGKQPIGLEVFSGKEIIERVPIEEDQVLSIVEEIICLKKASSDPYSPVGWSKCAGCVYRGTCWPKAEKSHDVSLVPKLDQGLARELRTKGINTISGLVERYSEETLAELQRPWGRKTQKVGKLAIPIIRSARALKAGKAIQIQKPIVTVSENYAMFDLEGMPPYLDELDKIYLWGLRVYGKKPGPFLAATSGFGPDGDKAVWEIFLINATRVFDEYGDIPFIHWHTYEKTHVTTYRDRWGDPDGVAERVLKNMIDLLRVTQESIALPLPSYSLKVVEKYYGYERKLPEANGSWAMAKYIEATETEDEAERKRVMDTIKAYNEEDLEAMWEVMKKIVPLN